MTYIGQKNEKICIKESKNKNQITLQIYHTDENQGEHLGGSAYSVNRELGKTEGETP